VSIGTWQSIIEFMGIAAVITNCCLLYFSSKALKTWINDRFDISSETSILWILVGVEHLIIIVKFVCAEAIPDIPGWVTKTF
jgi:hypothetical protein